MERERADAQPASASAACEATDGVVPGIDFTLRVSQR